MSIIGMVSQFLRSKYAKAFEEASKNPKNAQWLKLNEILKNNQGTEFGVRYRFKDINSLEEYQKLVPICTHKDIKHYLDRMVNGEKNILTFQPPIYYGITTGSSGTPKFTPITPAYRDEYQTVVQNFLYHIYREHPKAFDGKAIYFNGSAEKGKTPTGIPYGTMSGFNCRALPKILQKFYALPYEFSVFEDAFSKFYSMVLLAMPKNISMILGITGAPIIAFAHSLMNNSESLIKDLHDGSIRPDLKLNSAEKQLVIERHKPNPALAKELEKIMNKRNGKLMPMDIWPNLELLVCWKASNAGGFIKELDQLFEGKVAIRDAIYSATEGWCNIPYTDKVLGGPLAVNAHFYEFIEENAPDDTNVLFTHQLEVGKKYRIIYTTNGGMYRYDIGDILEVTEMYNNTPCVKFVRKVGQSCNIAGELMTDNHITEAIMNASNHFDFLVPFYSAIPDQKEFPPRYSIMIELPENLSKEKLTEIRDYIDDQICQINIDYKSLRDDNEMAKVSLKLLEKDSNEVFKRQQVSLGADEAQIKPLVLAQDMTRLSDLKFTGVEIV